MNHFDTLNGPEDQWPSLHAWRWMWIGLALGLATLASMCVPFQFEAAAGEAWLTLHRRELLVVLGNVVLFVPVGYAEGRLIRAFFGTASWVLALAVLDVGALSLIGETIQLWLPARDSGIIDVVANTLGGAMGARAGMARPRIGR